MLRSWAPVNRVLHSFRILSCVYILLYIQLDVALKPMERGTREELHNLKYISEAVYDLVNVAETSI